MSKKEEVLRGFADLHNHQFAYLGFGGMAFHGRAYGDPKNALPWCDFIQGSFPPVPIHGPGGTLDIMGNALRTFGYGQPLTALAGHKVGGYPEFDGWPRWDSVTHQAVHEDWLYRAVVGGLRLMVMLAVNSEHMCGQANRKLSCNDMEAVDRQLAEAKKMEADIDARSGGPGKGWYRIVTTPDEARVVIAAGKLAVVLGIEVDYLFNSRTERDLTEDQLRQQLDKYYALGVRHLFPIHFDNNGFGGAAFQNSLERGSVVEDPRSPLNMPGSITPLNPVETLPAPYHLQTEDARAFGYEGRMGRRNVKGLTGLGKTLICEMIARGMIIDVDHMSARSKADTLDICEAAGYPVVSGHTGFVEISHGAKSHEGQLLPQEIERIRRLGGMIAVIPHQGELHEIDTWRGPGQPVIPHTCGNSSNTVVQAYLYAVAKMQGGPVGFGTDMNGFAGLPGPRFHKDEACPGDGTAGTSKELAYPFTVAATGERMPMSVVGRKHFDINQDGLAHIGMLPDLIADMEVQGLTAKDIAPLLESAEGYVTTWERGWSRATTARHGTLLREASGAIWVIHGGAKFHVPSPEVLKRLFPSAMVRQLWDGAVDALPTIPRDGTLLRNEPGTVFVVYGGAKFGIPNPEIFNRLFDPRMVRQLWDGAVDALPTVPRDGTLVREASGAIWVIFGGAKFHVPSPEVLKRLYDPSMVRQLWDGAVDALPTVPQDGTLLREESDSKVYTIRGGQKIPATSSSTAEVRVVWDGGLAGIP